MQSNPGLEESLMGEKHNTYVSPFQEYSHEYDFVAYYNPAKCECCERNPEEYPEAQGIMRSCWYPKHVRVYDNCSCLCPSCYKSKTNEEENDFLQDSNICPLCNWGNRSVEMFCKTTVCNPEAPTQR